MHVTHVSLADFRSYETAELPLEPGVTALVGPNGHHTHTHTHTHTHYPYHTSLPYLAKPA